MASSVIAFCLDWERRVPVDGRPGRTHPAGRYAKIVESLAEVGTWDRTEFHGTRVVTGDVVAPEGRPEDYRRPDLLGPADRLPIRLRWTRGPAWDF